MNRLRVASTAVLMTILIAEGALGADQCPPATGQVFDPRLVVPAPCDPYRFPITETKIEGIGLDKDSNFKFVKRLQDAQKDIRAGLLVLALAGGPSGGRDSKRKTGLDLSIVPTRKTQCCRGQVVTRTGAKVKVDFYAEAQQRFFYGVPYIGEAGIRAKERAGLKSELSIGTECSELCQSYGAGAEVTGEVYINALSGMVDASGGIRGDAKAELMLCSSEPSTKAKVMLAGLALTAQASAAWGLYTTTWTGPILTNVLPMKVYIYPQ